MQKLVVKSMVKKFVRQGPIICLLAMSVSINANQSCQQRDFHQPGVMKLSIVKLRASHLLKAVCGRKNIHAGRYVKFSIRALVRKFYGYPN